MADSIEGSKSGGFRGIFTIPSTPFTADGAVDVAAFRRIVEFCVECGAHGLVYPVNASEFTSLSDSERMKLSEVLVEQNAGRLPTMIGVAGVTREVAEQFATRAGRIGADSVIAMPPYLVRGELSEQLIFEYYRGIADAGGLPVCIQNYVPPIGTNLSAEFMLRLCREIPLVEYIKEETVPSTIKLTQIVQGNDGSCKGVFGGAGGRYLIEEYRRGSAGNMPGCHVTDVVVAFWQALESGDESAAIRIYKELSPLFFYEHQIPGCYKEVLKRRGVIEYAFKRNGQSAIDEIGSRYLDDVLDALRPLMRWWTNPASRKPEAVGR
ncbi:MAG: dihydrodipicolinate synthase family protein [Spirochaetaceae bacterium]|nr:MAG: dihydrodipicolinate synthase family protein [Spirochaetaceae bacterium]